MGILGGERMKLTELEVLSMPFEMNFPDEDFGKTVHQAHQKAIGDGKELGRCPSPLSIVEEI